MERRGEEGSGEGRRGGGGGLKDRATKMHLPVCKDCCLRISSGTTLIAWHIAQHLPSSQSQPPLPSPNMVHPIAPIRVV